MRPNFQGISQSRMAKHVVLTYLQCRILEFPYMYIYIYVLICVFLYVYIYREICVLICVLKCTYIYIEICVLICVLICVSRYIFIYLFLCLSNCQLVPQFLQLQAKLQPTSPCRSSTRAARATNGAPTVEGMGCWW